MPEPTEDMRELLRAIQTEIGAGKGFGSDRQRAVFGWLLAGALMALLGYVTYVVVTA